MSKTMEDLRKPHVRALEQLYDAEIRAALGKDPLVRLVQSKARVFGELEEMGFAAHESITLPGRFPIVITGWVLTLAGNFAYCMSIDDADFEGERRDG